MAGRLKTGLILPLEGRSFDIVFRSPMIHSRPEVGQYFHIRGSLPGLSSAGLFRDLRDAANQRVRHGRFESFGRIALFSERQ